MDKYGLCLKIRQSISQGALVRREPTFIRSRDPADQASKRRPKLVRMFISIWGCYPSSHPERLVLHAKVAYSESSLGKRVDATFRALHKTRMAARDALLNDKEMLLHVHLAAILLEYVHVYGDHARSRYG